MTAPDIIFFAILAGFILYRLYTVLGKDDFNHPEQSQKGYKTKKKTPTSKADNTSKIVDFPGVKRNTQRPETSLEKRRKVMEPTITDSDTLKQLETIKEADTNFTAGSFLLGAKAAFEMTLNAFDQGDTKTLQSLLSEDVYRSFEKEINSLKNKHQIQETTLVSILSATITNVKVISKKACITVDFNTEQIYQLKGGDDKLIEGESSTIEEVKDRWTFEHDLYSNNPNWTIIST